MNDPDTLVPQVMTPSALEAQTKAEYDISIVTAHRFPRTVSLFLKRAESLATATPEIAAAMEYAKPVGGSNVKGPSTRLAEIVAATYGNLRVQARVISETATEIVAQGVAHDLETNVAQSTEVAVSILKRDGTRYGADQVATMRAAACSKARRNATFLVVPAALCLPIIAAARKVAVGSQETLPQRRKALLDYFHQRGVQLAAILAWLGVKAEGDIDLEKMADLIAARNTAKEEGDSLAELFAKPRADRMNDNFGESAPEAPAKTEKAEKVKVQKGPGEPPKSPLLDAIAKAASNGLSEDATKSILIKVGGANPGSVAQMAAEITAKSATVERVCANEILAAMMEGA